MENRRNKAESNGVRAKKPKTKEKTTKRNRRENY